MIGNPRDPNLRDAIILHGAKYCIKIQSPLSDSCPVNAVLSKVPLSLFATHFAEPIADADRGLAGLRGPATGARLGDVPVQQCKLAAAVLQQQARGRFFPASGTLGTSRATVLCQGLVLVSLVVAARLAHALRHGLSSLYLPLITKRGSASAAHTFSPELKPRPGFRPQAWIRPGKSMPRREARGLSKAHCSETQGLGANELIEDREAWTRFGGVWWGMVGSTAKEISESEI